jgi:CYTH domain-containing protein
MKKEEIERKFLLSAVPAVEYSEKIEILQFYTADGMRFRRELYSDGRVEYIKLRKNKLSRGVNEEEIFDSDANEFNRHVVDSDMIVRKTRYVYEADSLKFEVDKFHDTDLVMLEVELEDIDQNFEMPLSILENLKSEVTGNPFYDNSQIAKRTTKWQ